MPTEWGALGAHSHHQKHHSKLLWLVCLYDDAVKAQAYATLHVRTSHHFRQLLWSKWTYFSTSHDLLYCSSNLDSSSNICCVVFLCGWWKTTLTMPTFANNTYAHLRCTVGDYNKELLSVWIQEKKKEVNLQCTPMSFKEKEINGPCKSIKRAREKWLFPFPCVTKRLGYTLTQVIRGSI
jgi:hypothetical protein